MIVSVDWLSDYVQVPVPPETLGLRLAMAGLNHESTQVVGNDTAIELEVTSNRADCLGHVGVARELAAIFSRPLSVPDPRPLESANAVEDTVAIEIADSSVCPCYHARVIRGVRVGPSPKWLVDRLATLGIASVNNVVDVTNYVMMECGQPLHAFDLAKLRGSRIIVRRASEGEEFVAINHRRYELSPQMCVIADAVGPVALAGVMGGAESEIGAATVDLLLESAQFAPLAVRAAARGLSLSSDSSYRFERGPDPQAVDWAGRRAAQMILEIAGGRLERGVAAAGAIRCERAMIRLSPATVRRVLGIDVEADRQHAILRELGFEQRATVDGGTEWQSPSWRRDVTREIDLVEEIARIEGYDHVPEDLPVTPRPIETSRRDTVAALAAEAFVAAGLFEAMTRSVVDERLDAVSAGWSEEPSLRVRPPLVRGADRLRRTLVPSLLEAMGTNAAVGSPHGDLFEMARLYLPGREAGTLPEEPVAASFVLAGGYAEAKGVVEAVLGRLAIDGSGYGRGAAVRYRPTEFDLFEGGRAAEILLPAATDSHGARDENRFRRVGVIGEIRRAVLERFGLAAPVAAAELLLDRLDGEVAGERAIVRPSDFPAVDRDLNLVVDERIPWAEVASVIAEAAGPLLERLRLEQVWSDAEKLGAGRKSLLVSVRLRSRDGTLSGEETRRIIDTAVTLAAERCGATLR
jgi:phenylalanyl-tRNA synthetase beta chain